MIYVHPSFNHERRDTICQNSGYYQWFIPKYTTDGDSTSTVVTGMIIDKFGQELQANAIPTSEIGKFEYKQVLKTKNGCDSIAILHLYVNEISEIRDTLHLCDNSFTVWNNNVYVGEKYQSTIENSNNHQYLWL